MRLTSFTDYTLRSLMYLGMNRDKLVTIQEIADLHDISKNHLTKVIHQLGASGLVETVRGRHGGLRLNREPEDINIGEVVRDSESDFYIAECFESDPGHCAFLRDCALKRKLSEATEAFLHVLDGMTLADILPGPKGKPGEKTVLLQKIRI
ncbi:Rrf2 family transcriptional regulator [Pseudoduganella eburnea]|uniref:Rrf2 family transcriptional regulator n=1 Tax=Massilia eburnea TaxID=1776165 RepID=A0A6L6QM42_9BURK|nr:Rrf2 family transcriptional regulator [Massilia eburnea]MTW13369.1 Rrf2 family transcriptional regulator [Massilia eburnea]